MVNEGKCKLLIYKAFFASFNPSLPRGRDIVNLDAENRWGSGFMHMLSQDLKQELPEATGLTERNLYYCKKFYLLYNQANANLPQVGAELKPTTPCQIVPQVEGKLQEENLPQPGAEIQALVSAVPWGHHKYIMDKCGKVAKNAREDLERITACFLGIANVKECSMFPRDINRVAP